MNTGLDFIISELGAVLHLFDYRRPEIANAAATMLDDELMRLLTESRTLVAIGSLDHTWEQSIEGFRHQRPENTQLFALRRLRTDPPRGRVDANYHRPPTPMPFGPYSTPSAS